MSFNPEKYILSRPDLYPIVQEFDNDDKSYFYLVPDDPTYNERNIRERFNIGFPYIPEQFGFSNVANYNQIRTSQGEEEYLQYTGNNSQTINIDNILLDTRAVKRSFLSLVEILKNLMYSQKNPSFFYIVLQNRVFYPYALTRMPVVEKGWVNGKPVKGFISLSFIKSPVGLDTTFVQKPFQTFEQINPVILNGNNRTLIDIKRDQFDQVLT